MDVEGIGKAHEEVEQGAVVDGFGDLGVVPPGLTEAFDLPIADAMSMARQGLYEFQQQSMFRRKGGGLQVTIAQGRRGSRVLLSLQLQEPGMAAESIVAAVERRDIGGDHFVLGPAERTVREVQPAGLMDSSQEVGS